MTFKNIVWLASYPKSGNTWTRIFLANYLLNPPEALPINQAHRVGMGDAIAKSYAMVDNGRYDPRDRMRHLALREKVLRGIAANKADMNLVKTHNINRKAFGVDMILQRYSRSAIYIVRNPLDVVVSYARHLGQTLEYALEFLSRGDTATEADAETVEQYVGTWSEHVRSWTRARKFPVHLMRYEDLQSAPHETFAKMLTFLKIDVDEARLARAVEFSSFNELQKQESEGGFVEKPKMAEKFFHSGSMNQWQEVLTEEQITRFRDQHARMMTEYGYNETG